MALLAAASFLGFAAFEIRAQNALTTVTARSSSELMLAPPHQRVFFDATPFSPGSVVPAWDKGYLVSRVAESGGPDRPTVWLYDSRGVKFREAAVWLPGASRVIVGSAAVTPDGRIAVVGNAERNDRPTSSFVAVTDANGNLTRVIETNPYHPSKICVAPDGTAWTFGWSKREPRDPGIPEAPMLRHFDFQKGELATYLPLSTFNTQWNPAGARGEGRSTFFTCAPDRVTIVVEETSEFIEMDYATETIRRWRVDLSPHNLAVRGSLAVLDSGEVFAYMGRALMKPGLRGLFQLQRDATTNTVRWLPVEGHTGNTWDLSMINDLLGAEGDSLVYLTRDDWPAVKWARPTRK
jgi:hypothetical protein